LDCADPSTWFLPTGTGKTEVTIAATLTFPTDALRQQTADKFIYNFLLLTEAGNQAR
jgi:hypothetical protein